ncbi:tetratricopeptide repeat protein [Kutzneria viridogrisea]|uniref:Tetratricopeptide (TPR) repeat protein n=1 Tax=Kutzneria viridogrisea TaxID=47990 RepID=A0ABR6BLF7_9PSEU|nr:tetratricopeptide (TPR) repeat protein [Kutzneria viridogrisea]
MGNDLSGTVHGPVIQARDIHQLVANLGERPSRLPHEAPAPPYPFVNQYRVHEQLDAVFSRAREADRPLLVCLYGPGGVGTTGTACAWAKRNEHLFPDGIVYLRLSCGRDELVESGEALGSALVALGVPAGELRPTAEERAADLRSVCQGRKVLFVLDDVHSPGQVRPFVPSETGCAVVATSRWLAQGLHGMGFQLIRVAPLATGHAQELLTAVLSEQLIELDTESEQTLLRSCYGYPGAIRLMAASLVGKTARQRTRILGRVAEHGFRALDGEVQLQLVDHLDFAFQRLPEQAARAYRLLAWHPGPEFALAAAERVLALGAEDTGDVLDTLATAGLLTELPGDRFRFHDLAQDHARGVSGPPDPVVIGRLGNWYLQCTIAFDKVLSTRPRVNPLYHRVPVADHADREAALRWLETERVNLTSLVPVVMEARHFDLAWQLCEALWGLYHLHGHYDDWIGTHQVGLDAAQRCDDPMAVMRLSSQLGSAYLGVGELGEAGRHFQLSLETARSSGHSQGEQSALEWQGKVALRGGDPQTALDLFDQSEQVEVEAELRPRVAALLDLQRGRAWLAAHNPLNAKEVLERTREFFDGTTEGDNQAKTRLELARALLALGEQDRARSELTEAERLFAADGSLRKQAEVLQALGDPESLGKAEGIYRRLGSAKR